MAADPLARLTRAVAAKRRADREYRAALTSARETESVQAIARAAGISRQAVYKLTRPA